MRMVYYIVIIVFSCQKKKLLTGVVGTGHDSFFSGIKAKSMRNSELLLSI